MANSLFGNMLSSWGQNPNGSIDQEVFSIKNFGTFSIEKNYRILYNTPLCAKSLEEDEHSANLVLSEAIKKLRDSVDLSDPIALVNHGTMSMVKSFRAPPVESSKLEDIVKYEARQQIPFDISDVEWRWLRAHTTSLDNDPLSGDEVLISVIKKDAVSRFAARYKEAGLSKSPDLMQLEELLLADYLWSFYPKFQDPNNRDAVVVISMHAKSTKVIITTGNNLWTRDIATGSSHLAGGDSLPDFLAEITKTIMFHRDIKMRRNGKKIRQFMLLGGGLCNELTNLRLVRNLQEIGITPFEGESANHTIEAEIKEDPRGNMLAPMMAGFQRLGLGKFKMNFLTNGRVFKPKTKVAWGIDFGDHGITAVKVRVQ